MQNCLQTYWICAKKYRDIRISVVVRNRRDDIFFTSGITTIESTVGRGKKIAHFDFHSKVEIETRIREIADLADSMKGMKATIQSFLDIASSLASENNYDRLLARVLKEMSEITGARSGLLYLYEPQKDALDVVQIYADHHVVETDAQSIPMSDRSHPVVAACYSGSHILQLQPNDLRLFSVLYLSYRM
jgi:hypothetical protein